MKVYPQQPTKDRHHALLLPFLFLIIFFTQLLLWRLAIFADQKYWLEKVVLFGQELQHFNLVYTPNVDAPHPGTFFLLFAQLFRILGFSPNYSSLATEILLNTVLISVICLLAFRLFPKKLWWLSAGGFFIFNNFAFYSNPVDIIVSELIVIAFLCTLWHFQKPKNTPLAISLTLGASLGLGLASRIHITVAISLLLFTCLFFVINQKKLFLIILTTIFIAWLFIPYLWWHPADVFSFFSYTNTLYGSSTIALRTAYHLPISRIITSAPLASITLFLLVFFIFLPKRFSTLEIPKKFLIALFFIVSITAGLIFRSNLVDIRFLYPLIFLLQIFLPLFLAELIKKIIKKQPPKKNLVLAVLTINTTALIFLASYLLKFGFMYESTLFFTLQIQFLSTIFLLEISNGNLIPDLSQI